MSYTAVEEIRTYHSANPVPKWLQMFRGRAAERLTQIEWPTSRDEEWRRTSLRTIDFSAYSIASPADLPDGSSVESSTGAGASPSERLPAVEESAGVVRVANGVVTSATVSPAAEAQGVLFGSASRMLKNNAVVEDEVTRLLAGYLDGSDNRLQIWHASLLSDAVLLYVPAGVEVSQPFVVDAVGGGDGVVASTAVVVLVGESASVSLVRRLSSGSEGEVLYLDGTIARVADNGALGVCEIQDTNDESLLFGHGAAVVSRDARLDRTEVHAGGDFVKARFSVELTGPGADVNVNGLYCATESQHIDLRTVQNHSAPRSTSRAFYRGAVREEAHSVYQGLIRVAPEAPGTDAYLTNNNLVLSESARADSIPSLNIAIDDVKCSHGSTTGKLDENQLFYLKSRGWSDREARETLIEAFFEEVIALTPESVHELIRGLVASRMIDVDGDERG